MSDVANRSSALAEAADRLDRMARMVKDQQLSETRQGTRVALQEAYVASPEEAWAKKFMTQAIGPAAINFAAPSIPVFAGQAPVVGHGFVAQPAAVAAQPFARKAQSGDPRLAIARSSPASPQPPRRKRSWLGWLLLGR